MYIMTHFLKNVLTFLLQYDIYQLLLKLRLGQKLPFSLSELLFRKERVVYYIDIEHPLTFDGRASFTRGLVFFETKRYLVGAFNWVMFDKDHTSHERFFVARKSDGMPRS